MKAVIKDEIAEFTSLIAAGVEAWLKAGEIVARSLDADPEWIDKVCLRCPEITAETVLAFDRVGRQKLHPRLLLSNKPGAARLRSLPIELQGKYLVEPIPLLIKNGAKVEDLAVSVWNLTVEQCRQAFDGDSLRSLGAQRAWLESRQELEPMTLTNPINPRTSAGRRVALIFGAAEHHCGLRVCSGCGDWLGLARELAEGAITREVCPACGVADSLPFVDDQLAGPQHAGNFSSYVRNLILDDRETQQKKVEVVA